MNTSVNITIAVSAFFGLIAAIISKENKVSEFRQKWVDELRSDVCSAIAHLAALQNLSWNAEVDKATTNAKDDDQAKYNIENTKLSNEHIFGVNQALTSIKLRINEKDSGDREFLIQLKKLEKAFDDIRTTIEKRSWQGKKALDDLPEYQKFLEEEKNFIVASKVILKSEWERVKKGEKVFNWTVKIIFGGLIVTVLALIFSALPISICWDKSESKNTAQSVAIDKLPKESTSSETEQVTPLKAK